MTDRVIGKREMEDLLNGAAFFSSGGGGPRDMAERMLADVVESRAPISLQALDSVDPKGIYAVTAYLGAPAAGAAEQTFEAPTNAVRRLELVLRNKLSGIVPVEVGAVSCFAPITVAARLGIPVIDGDGAGRSVPEMTMLTYAVECSHIAPVVMATEHDKAEQGHSVVLHVADAGQAEELARPIVASATFGNVGGLALWAMTGEQLQRSAIGGTLTEAMSFGAALRQARESGQDPVSVVLGLLKGTGALLLRGRVVKMEQQTSGGFDCGLIELEPDGGGPLVSLYNQNESLIAWRADRSSPLLMGPDLLCYVTPDGRGMSNPDLVVGQEVALIGVKARGELAVPKIVSAFLELLRGIGYRGPYVPFDPGGERGAESEAT